MEDTALVKNLVAPVAQTVFNHELLLLPGGGAVAANAMPSVSQSSDKLR